MKWALIHLGSEIVYGLMFFAYELENNGHDIHWFDGDNDYQDDLLSYCPDYVCFGPLSSEFAAATVIAMWVKNNTNARTVFGGHHVKALPEVSNRYIDHVVLGGCYSVIDQIINNPPTALDIPITGGMISPLYMRTSSRKYFNQVPRIGNRSRKFIMAHFGCVYNCTFCCTGHTRKLYGQRKYKELFLTKRPVETLIDEAKVMKEFGTKEISLNDDDALYNTRSIGYETRWLKEFAQRWNTEIGIPLYANVTPKTVVSAVPEAITTLSSIVDTVQMGVETADPGSRKLFNRKFQNEEQITEACKILWSHGIKTKLEVIVGLPNIKGLVPDPIEDAIHTVQLCQRIASEFPEGVIKASCHALILFPGTELWNLCKEHGVQTRDGWKYALYEGKGSVVFPSHIEERLNNIVKMTLMFVKYNMHEDWIRALIDMKATDSAREKLSKAQYIDSLMFRSGTSRSDLNNATEGMTFRY